MRTTHPQVKSNDSLTINNGLSHTSSEYRGHQDVVGYTESERNSEESGAGLDGIDFSTELATVPDGRGDELAANLLAAWG